VSAVATRFFFYARLYFPGNYTSRPSATRGGGGPRPPRRGPVIAISARGGHPSSRKDEKRFCLTWRGALPCDKKALKVEEIAVGLQALDFVGGTA